MNFGVSGFGTTQAWLAYDAYASLYDPDLVMLAFTPRNDVRNNSPALETERMRPFAVLEGDRLTIDMSFQDSARYRRTTSVVYRIWRHLSVLRVVQAASFVMHRVMQTRMAREERQEGPGARELGLSDEVYRPPENEDWRDAWEIMEAVIERLRDDVHEAGGEFFLTSVSRSNQVSPDLESRRDLERRLGVTDLYYPERRLANLAERLAIPYVALAPRLADLAERTGVYFHGFSNTGLGRGHWNEDAHREAGIILAQTLCKEFEFAGTDSL